MVLVPLKKSFVNFSHGRGSKTFKSIRENTANLLVINSNQIFSFIFVVVVSYKAS